MKGIKLEIGALNNWLLGMPLTGFWGGIMDLDKEMSLVIILLVDIPDDYSPTAFLSDRDRPGLQ